MWIFRRIRNQIRYAKRSFERKVLSIKLGFNVEDTYSLDQSFAQWITPRLKYFRNNLHSYPCSLTKVEWQGVIDQMIEGFEIAANDDAYMGVSQEGFAKIDVALDLFKKHFYDLWD